MLSLNTWNYLQQNQGFFFLIAKVDNAIITSLNILTCDMLIGLYFQKYFNNFV